MSLLKANLDPWHVLKTVIDTGGFSQAANQLQRSQSAISYSISKLEQQLQLELLTIQGRRAVLTEAGQLLLRKARHLLTDYHQLVDYAEHLRLGHATEISLWIDGLYPIQRLQQALLAFQRLCPQTRLSMQHGLADTYLNEIDIIISPQRHPDRDHQELDEVELLAVAHAKHPLFRLGAPIERPSLKPFTQVMLESESQAETEKETEQGWPVTTLQQAKEYITLGLAYGWLPAEMVDSEIKSGELKLLPMAHGQRYRVAVYMQMLAKNSGNEDVLCLGKLIHQPNETS